MGQKQPSPSGEPRTAQVGPYLEDTGQESYLPPSAKCLQSHPDQVLVLMLLLPQAALSCLCGLWPFMLTRRRSPLMSLAAHAWLQFQEVWAVESK